MYSQLKDIQIGDRFRIVGYEDEPKSYRHKLLAMGLVPGTQIELVRIAPFGDPLEFKARGYSICLRRKEAAIVHLEKISNE